MTNDQEIKKVVKEKYAEIALATSKSSAVNQLKNHLVAARKTRKSSRTP